MSDRLQKLYHPIIRKHNASPINFEKREEREVVLANNSICGDRFEFFVSIDKDCVKAISFYGFGCAVSKASSSILVKMLEGRTTKDAIELCDSFINYLNGKEQGESEIANIDFDAFSAIWEFPERYACAALSWTEIKDFLSQKLAGN